MSADCSSISFCDTLINTVISNVLTLALTSASQTTLTVVKFIKVGDFNLSCCWTERSSQYPNCSGIHITNNSFV